MNAVNQLRYVGKHPICIPPARGFSDGKDSGYLTPQPIVPTDHKHTHRLVI